MKHFVFWWALLVLSLSPVAAQSLPVIATAADAGMAPADFERAVHTLRQAVAACRAADHARLGALSIQGTPPSQLALPAGLVCYSLIPLAPGPGLPGPCWLALLQVPADTRPPAAWPWAGSRLRALRSRDRQPLILEQPQRYVGFVLHVTGEEAHLCWP